MDVADLTARRLAALLARTQREGRVPSLAAALVRDGSVVWLGSRGRATGRAQAPPAVVHYRIGSITKTMTAALVLQLRDEGRLSLGDPVSAYLPEVTWPVSLRALLAHAGGIVAEPPGEWWERAGRGPFAALAASLSGITAPHEPGATHHYSNLGYALLGEVVARLRGRSWEECLSQRLLGPLGMRRTGWSPAEPYARGYSVAPYAPTLTPEPATDTGSMAPAGQLWSTVTDLAAFTALLLGDRPDVLEPSSVEEMCVPQAGTAVAGLASGYGLGIRLVPGGSGTLAGHTGSMPGFQASMFVDRKRRTGAVVLANATAGLPTDRVAPALLALLEDCEPTPPPTWTPVPEVAAEVAEVLGVWHWGNTAHVAIWDGAELHLAHATTGERAAAFRLSEGVLVGVAGYHHGEPLEVVRGPDGRVSHLVASTFVLTRTPYDPDAPIPGGAPPPR